MKVGTRVTCEDIETGETESAVIKDNFALICDGQVYLDHEARYANGTVVLTLKRHAAARTEEGDG